MRNEVFRSWPVLDTNNCFTSRQAGGGEPTLGPIWENRTWSAALCDLHFRTSVRYWNLRPRSGPSSSSSATGFRDRPRDSARRTPVTTWPCSIEAAPGVKQDNGHQYLLTTSRGSWTTKRIHTIGANFRASRVWGVCSITYTSCLDCMKCDEFDFLTNYL